MIRSLLLKETAMESNVQKIREALEEIVNEAKCAEKELERA